MVSRIRRFDLSGSTRPHDDDCNPGSVREQVRVFRSQPSFTDAIIPLDRENVPPMRAAWTRKVDFVTLASPSRRHRLAAEGLEGPITDPFATVPARSAYIASSSGMFKTLGQSLAQALSLILIDPPDPVWTSNRPVARIKSDSLAWP